MHILSCMTVADSLIHSNVNYEMAVPQFADLEFELSTLVLCLHFNRSAHPAAAATDNTSSGTDTAAVVTAAAY